MNRYMYRGPVMAFNTLMANNWSGETMASSEAKARSNLEYQYKKKNNWVAQTKVTLPGKIIRMD